MLRLKHSFRNGTDRTQFINLEMSTSRFRLDPGEELILFFGADEIQDKHGAALRTEVISCGDHIELVVWAEDDRMYYPDGRPAPFDFGGIGRSGPATT